MNITLKSRQNIGATLIEVIVAMLLLALMVASLYASFNQAQRMITRAEHHMMACYWAMDQIEVLRQGVVVGDDAMTAIGSAASFTTFGPVGPGGGLNQWRRWRDVTATYPANYNKIRQDYGGAMQWRMRTAPGMPGGLNNRTGWRGVVVEVEWNE